MKQPFLGINITVGKYSDFIGAILGLINSETSSYVCVANVHMLVEASQDSQFADIVNGADICTPDGMPLVLGLKALCGLQQDRVAGMDLMPDLLQEAERCAIPVFFYGGTQSMLDKTRQYVSLTYPNLVVAGMHSPPFRQLTTEEENEGVAMINASGAKVVFVALGCPKQEKWMHRMKGRISMPMIGIGGALPVMVGIQKRSPTWMQRLSLEWLFRLGQEPKRLFKRYTVTNSLFIGMLLNALLKQQFRIKKG